jgi:hypothetical protein
VDPLLSGYQDSVTRDIALTKIKRKIQSDKGDYAVLSNVIQDVYELRRTISGGLDLIDDLVNTLHGLVTSGRYRGRDLVSMAAEAWLTWSFGIKPTISDANDLIDSIAAYLSRKDHIKHFQASHYADSKNSTRSSVISPARGVQCRINEEVYRNSSYKFIAAINYVLLSGNNYGPQEHFHVHPTDIVPMLWELLPWSWVADYIVTAGAFLEDTFQSNNDILVYGIENHRLSHSLVGHVTDVTYMPGWQQDSLSITPHMVEFGSLNRAPLSALPGRIFRFHTSFEMEKNSLAKIANLVSIGIGRTR